MTPENIHKIADKMNISWDGDNRFMSWCKKIIGKKKYKSILVTLFDGLVINDSIRI